MLLASSGSASLLEVARRQNWEMEADPTHGSHAVTSLDCGNHPRMAA